MAKIVEDIVVIKFSKLVKDSTQDSEPLVTSEQVLALEQVAQELAGDSIVIEVLRDGN